MTLIPHYPLAEVVSYLNLTDFRSLGQTSRSHQHFFRSEAPWAAHIHRLGLQLQQPFSFHNVKVAFLREIEAKKAELQRHINLDIFEEGHYCANAGYPLGKIERVVTLSQSAATVAELLLMREIIAAHWPAKVLEMLLATKQIEVSEFADVDADQRCMNTIAKVIQYAQIISDSRRFVIVPLVEPFLNDEPEVLQRAAQLVGSEHRICRDRCIRSLKLEVMYYPIPELVFDFDVDAVTFSGCIGKFPLLTKEHSNYSFMNFLSIEHSNFNFPQSLEHLVRVKAVTLWGYHQISPVFLTLPNLRQLDVEGAYEDPEGVLDHLRQKGVTVRKPPNLNFLSMATI